MANEIPGLNKLNRIPKILGDIGNRIDAAHKKTDAWLDEVERKANSASRSLTDVGNSIDGVTRKMGKGSSGWSKWGKAADKVGKSILTLNTGILSMGFDFLIKGIQDVYRLKEKWAKATGVLNTKMGALTPNMKTLTKTANQWRGTMRGLTDDFELGASLFAEYASTLETTGKHVKEFSKINLVLARGFNLGGKGAGDLTQAFRSMNTGAKEATNLIGQLTVDAELLGVNTQSLVSDLADSGDYMVRFGKAGTKSLIQSAVFLKQFNIGLKDTNGLMDTFDRFDSATESTARLNTIFGTTISSMDMLLSQDPAERIEKVRQGLLAQGKTFEKLSYFERRSLAETLNLGEKEIAFMLDESKAHISLGKFRENAAKKQITEKQAQAKMQKQLQKTSETLFAFGAAFDRITVAIGNALRPLLEALGLAKGGGKEFKSFGQVMKSVTDTVVQFFNKLAKSEQWIDMMKSLADWMKTAAKGIASFIASGSFVKWIDTAVSGLKLFMKVSAGLIALWTAGKAASAISNIAALASGGGKAGAGLLSRNRSIGQSQQWDAKIGRRAGGSLGTKSLVKMGGRALAGAGIGAGTAQLTGGGTMGGSIGGMLGGALGMFAGPIGSAVGGAVGGWLGKKGEGLVRAWLGKGKTKEATEGEKLQQRLNDQQKRSVRLSEENNMQLAANNALQAKIKSDRKQEQRSLKKSNKGSFEQATAAREVAKRSLELGNVHGKMKQRFEEIAKSSGPLSLSNNMLSVLQEKGTQTHRALQELTKKTMERIGISELENKSKMARLNIASERSGLDFTSKDAIASMNSSGNKDLAEQMKSGEFGKAKDFANQVVKEQEKTIANREAENYLLSEKLRTGRILSKQERDTYIKNVNHLTFLDKQIKAAKEFKEKIDAAGHAAERKIALDIKESKIQKASIDTQRFQLAMLSSEDFRAAAVGTPGAKGKLSSEMVSILEAGLAAKDSFASGGIVSRPTRALIGEAGPEAVIPLKALARGRGRMPNKFGGAAAQKLVNYAGGAGSSSDSGQKVTVVAGDVYLDGAKVGRHLVRDMIGNGSI